MQKILDGAKLRTEIIIFKYAKGKVPGKDAPDEITKPATNLFLTSGRNNLWNLIKGDSANHFNAADSRIGIGNDKTTAPNAAQTDLQGASKTYVAMDANYPLVPSGGSIQFKATFGENDANYEWGEFVIKNNVSGICINRSTNSTAGWGTKSVGSTWAALVTLSFVNP